MMTTSTHPHHHPGDSALLLLHPEAHGLVAELLGSRDLLTAMRSRVQHAVQLLAASLLEGAVSPRRSQESCSSQHHQPPTPSSLGAIVGAIDERKREIEEMHAVASTGKGSLCKYLDAGVPMDRLSLRRESCFQWFG